MKIKLLLIVCFIGASGCRDTRTCDALSTAMHSLEIASTGPEEKAAIIAIRSLKLKISDCSYRIIFSDENGRPIPQTEYYSKHEKEPELSHRVIIKYKIRGEEKQFFHVFVESDAFYFFVQVG